MRIASTNRLFLCLTIINVYVCIGCFQFSSFPHKYKPFARDTPNAIFQQSGLRKAASKVEFWFAWSDASATTGSGTVSELRYTEIRSASTLTRIFAEIRGHSVLYAIRVLSSYISQHRATLQITFTPRIVCNFLLFRSRATISSMIQHYISTYYIFC